MSIKLEGQFDQCPNCGSNRRLAETLANEVKERKLAREEWTFCLQVIQGVAVDKAKEKSIPIGSELPALKVFTDVCIDCGTIYATKMYRDTVKKTLVLPPRPANNNLLKRN